MGEHGRHLVWQGLAAPGLEHVRIHRDRGRRAIDGRTVRAPGGILEDLRWHVECDAGWRSRSIRVLLRDRLHPLLAAECDGRGRWTVRAGGTRGRLTGCVDVDLVVTPFTPTLPIRRFEPWRTGEEIRLRVAVADPLEGVFHPARQSYTLESVNGDVRVFLHRRLDSGAEARLSVDPSGFVIDYGGEFRRAWSG